MKSILKKTISLLLSTVMIISASSVALAADTLENDNRTTAEVVSDEFAEAQKRGQADIDNFVEGVDYAPGEVLICAPAGEVKLAKNGDVTVDGELSEEYTLDDCEIVSEDIEIPADSGSKSESAVLYLARTDKDIKEVCEQLSSEQGIYYAQPNFKYLPDAAEDAIPSESEKSKDYLTNQKWWMDLCQVEEAYTYTGGVKGDDVVVSVIDTGCNTAHYELQDTLWRLPSNTSVCGYNAETDTNLKVGDNKNCVQAHGTHTSGSVAMAANGWGYVGTSPNAKLMVMKANRGDAGSFYSSEIIECLNKSVEWGADVISLSLGGYGFDLSALLTYEKCSKDAVIVTSAGNDHMDTTEKLHYPSAYSCVIGVMAIGNKSSKTKLATFSNYDTTGEYYKVAAPGTAIYSCSNVDDNGYLSMQGTSMATPIAAGMIATYISYMRSLNKNWTAPQFKYMVETVLNRAGNTVEVTANSKANQPIAYAQDYRFKVFNLKYLCTYGKTLTTAKTVSITNSDLMTLIKNTTGLSTLTNYDVANISYLDMSSLSLAAVQEAIEKITGLQYFDFSGNSNVKNYIKSNGINSLISALPRHTFAIKLAGCSITDISAFASADLPALNYLDLSSNSGLKDISALKKFTDMRTLNISGTGVSDITAISSMTYLYSLTANNCSITNAMPLYGLKELSYCDLKENMITDVDAFAKFKGYTLLLDSNYLSTTYDSDYVSALATVKTNMENNKDNKDRTLTLTYASQKSVTSSMLPATRLSVGKKSVTVSRADFYNRTLTELTNAKVYDKNSTTAEIYPYVKWSYVTNQNYTNIPGDYGDNTTHIPGIITEPTTLKYTASLADGSSATEVTINITAPKITAVSFDDRTCGKASYTMKATTNTYTDRLLFASTNKRLFEIKKGGSGVTTTDSGTTRTWSFSVTNINVREYSTLYVFPGDELGYSVNNSSYSSNTSDLSGSYKKVYMSVTGLSHSYTTTSTVAATCETEGKTVKKCSVCSYNLTTTKAALGHSFSTKKTIAPTCTEYGSEGYTCTRTGCGKSFRGDYATRVEPTGHTYVRGYDSSTSSYVYTCKSCGDSYSNEVDGVYVPTYVNREKAGLSASFQNASGSYVDYIPLSSNGNITSNKYYLVLTNNSTQTAKISGMSATYLNSRYALDETSNIVLTSGETKKIAVSTGNNPSSTNYYANLTINYTLSDFYDLSTGNLAALKAYTSIQFYYLPTASTPVTQVYDAPITGRKVDVDAGLSATYGYLNMTDSTTKADPASLTAEYYVDYGKYPTWQSAGFKWKFSTNYDNQYYFQHQDKYSANITLGGTYANIGSLTWTGASNTISNTTAAQLLSKNDLGNANNKVTNVAWSGNMPKGSTTSTAAMTVKSSAGSSGDGLQIHASEIVANSAYFNITLNVYSYDKTALRTAVQTAWGGAYISAYYDTTVWSSYCTALRNGAQYLGIVKTNEYNVKKYGDSLTTAAAALKTTSNIVKGCCTTYDYNYGANDRRGTNIKTSRYYIAPKAVATYDIPLETDYVNATNRHTAAGTVNFTANTTSSSKYYYYWTINCDLLKQLIEEAKAIAGDAYTRSSFAAVTAKIEAALTYATEDGSESPSYQSYVDTAKDNLEAAIKALEKRMTAEQKQIIDDFIADYNASAFNENVYCDTQGIDEVYESVKTLDETDTSETAAQALIDGIKGKKHQFIICVKNPLNGVNGYFYYACNGCDNKFKALSDGGGLTAGNIASDSDLAAGFSLPAPFINDFVAESGYNYGNRGAALRYTKEDRANPAIQPTRFTCSAKIPEGVTQEDITDYGFVWTLSNYVNGAADNNTFAAGGDFVTENAEVPMQVTSKQNGGITNFTLHDSDGDGANDTYTYNLVVRIKNTNWQKQYAVRSFITYNYMGESVTVYDDMATSRSVEYIAQRIVESDSEKEEVKNFFQNKILDYLSSAPQA